MYPYDPGKALNPFAIPSLRRDSHGERPSPRAYACDAGFALCALCYERIPENVKLSANYEPYSPESDDSCDRCGGAL